MPYVNTKITDEGVTKEQKAALIKGVTNLLQEVLNKNLATTVVVIDEVNTDNWGIMCEQFTELRKQAAKACATDTEQKRRCTQTRDRSSPHASGGDPAA